jgi:hypothetical protein
VDIYFDLSLNAAQWLMIALEIKLNGKRICVAGAEDLGVLTAQISAVGKLGKKTVSARSGETTSAIFYSVGGLTSLAEAKNDVHLRWKSVAPLKIGDVVEVRILETEKVDRAPSRTRAKPKAASQRSSRRD